MKPKNDRILPAKKWVYSLYFVIASCFVLLSKVIGDLARDGNVVWNGSYFVETLSVCILLGASLGGCLGYLFLLGSKVSRKENKILPFSGKVVFWGSALLILIAWFPYFLAYYPCIGAYDISIQMWQIDIDFYYDHHPLMHTLTLRFFLSLGDSLFANQNTGLALYSLTQMLFLALSMSYGVWALAKFRVHRGAVIGTLCFCMFYPFHGFLSVSVTKDLYFAAFFIVLTVAILSLLLDKPRQKFRTEYLLITLSTIGTILYRNNGKFAILAPMAVLAITLIFYKKERKFYGGIFFLITTGFLIGNLLLSMISYALNADQGDKREMLSMPIQQFARCMIYHGGVGIMPEDDNTMTDRQKSLINDFILHEGYLNYTPQISDPVKNHTNTSVVLRRTKDFTRTYLELLFTYPGDFFNAVLATNAGYLSPFDETHGNIYSYADIPNLGYVQTHWQKEELSAYPVYQDSKWPTLYNRLQKWSDKNEYLEYPVLKFLFVPGSFLWTYVLIATRLLLKKKYAFLLPLSYVAGLYLTLFLGPCTHLRYLYPIIAVLPFTLLLSKDIPCLTPPSNTTTTEATQSQTVAEA